MILCMLSLLTLPSLAAPDDVAPPELSERLIERLGVTTDVAEELASLMAQHRETMRAHREAIKATADALKAARDGGDARTMKQELRELRRLRDEARSLHDRYEDDVMRMLTIDQQAQWALLGLRRHARKRGAALPENLR